MFYAVKSEPPSNHFHGTNCSRSSFLLIVCPQLANCYFSTQAGNFVGFMNDPANPVASLPPSTPTPEEQWKDITGHEDLEILTEANFDTISQQYETMLVMFYAPCKCLVSSLKVSMLKNNTVRFIHRI